MDLQPYFPKELSWLAFNERVLQEAQDTNNPVIERLRFLGIYSNNLDEFFRVRVAEVNRRIALAEEQADESLLAEELALKKAIEKKVIQLSKQFDQTHKQVLLALARYKIYLSTPSDLHDRHIEWLNNYFFNKILRHITPIFITSKVDLNKRLSGEDVYFYVALKREGKKTNYAVVQLPTEEMSRFIVLPSIETKKKKHIILLDHVVKMNLATIFRGFIDFTDIEAYAFKITRDADFQLDQEIDESYLEKMSESIKQRIVGEPTRVIHDEDMPTEMVNSLANHMQIKADATMIAAAHYRNFKDFIGFPNVGREYLENAKLPAISANRFNAFNTAFEAITAHDILLYYPYHRFLHFTEFVRQAAFDRKVTHIRINIYRLASNSRIINSLVDAVNNGKKVTVVVELRARFDEVNNIEWARKMTDAGIRVVFGNPNIKIHSKVCIISRIEAKELIHYSHFGTGNFNEKTAKIYTDYSLFTKNQELGEEALRVFDYIINPYRNLKFQHLQISPINARTKIQSLIRNEIQQVNQGNEGQIIFKVNNLVDTKLIDDLYRASQAGVKIKGIIRGMCSLVPGVAGLSENIEIISVVDRFLEHPRVMYFHNNGDAKVFISSADWMTRNMDFRIEVGCPIYDQTIVQQIKEMLDLQLQDTMKARQINADQTNPYVRRGNRKKRRSQIDLYHYLLEQNERYDQS